MPNLVTIIFAILVAPSKSLEAPEKQSRYIWNKDNIMI